MKVVVADWDLGEREPLLGIFKPAGWTVKFADCESAADVAAACRGAEALVVRYAPVPREVFERAPALRIVSRMGIGEWQVDLAAAEEHHVAVAHCPKYCTDEAVAHTMALVLALNRRLATAREAARAGLWSTYGPGVEVLPTSSMTLGIIGLGRVGAGLAVAAEALGMEVLGCDPYLPAAPGSVEMVDLETLLRESDVVCLLCPATAETRRLMNAERLALMKPGAVLVNTARGALVDEAALIAALDEGRLAGAALDVLEAEPPPPDHPLLHRDDVWLTPHVGYYSEESTHELKIHAARNVVHYLTGERVSGLLTPDFRRI